MADLRALETKLGKDKAYSRASGFTEKERAMGFVCPRADAYGAREGVIPPGVAAVRGLVPKGMKRIKPGDIAKHANEARDEGLSATDQYRAYYGRGAQAQAAANPAPPVPNTPDTPDTPNTPDTPRILHIPQVAPAVALPPAPNKNGRRKAKAASAAPPPRPPVPPRPPIPLGEEVAVPRDPDDPGMFSRWPDGYRAEDTLDGFYEELGRLPRGTGEAGSETVPDMVLQAGEAEGQGPGQAVPAPSPAHGDAAPRGTSSRVAFPAVAPVPAPPTPDQFSAAVASLVAERDQLRRMADDLSGEVGRLREMLEGYAARDRHYAGIEQELAAEREARKSAEAAVPPLVAETVRVALSEQEQKLKVGGRGWECNIMGALHFGRSDRSLVLTVSDPGYASELFAEIQPGEVAVLSAAGRTSCAYSGRCAKIYGDAGSPDFIAVLWLDVAPTE